MANSLYSRIFFSRRALKAGLAAAIISLACLSATAQYHLELLQQAKGKVDFEALRRTTEAHYDNTFKGKGSGYKQWKRYEWWHRMHLNPDGSLANEAFQSAAALQKIKSLPVQQAANGSWTVVGPVWNQGTGTGNGRPNCIAYHPTNSNIIYVGFPQGGMWKGVVNAGGTSATWTPMTDDLPTGSIASIAIDPNNANIMYLLTGDGNRSDGYSIGLLKSTDGGYSWKTTGLTFSQTGPQYGFKVLINPLRSATIFVVTNRGMYYSYNGGTSFTTATYTSLSAVPGCYDIEYFPDDTTRMAASSFNVIMSSSNGGKTWTNRSAQLPVGSRRIALAVSPNAPAGTIYMYIGTRDSALVGGIYQSRYKGVYRSTDYGATYVLRNNSPNISGYNNDGSDRAREQSDFDMDLAASPTNGSLLLAGTHNIWRSTNAGASFGTNSVSHWSASSGIPYIHEDINFISFNPDGTKAFVGSDGGVYCSTDNGTTWNDLTYGLVISQFYRINVHPVNSNIIVNGAQDAAGNVRVGSTSEFKQVNGGDGMSCMIDYGNDQILYTSYAEDVFKSIDGGNSVAANIKPSDASGPWVTPLAMNYNNPATIFYGSLTPDDIYRSTNRGDSWTSIGGSARDDMITCPSNSNRLYGLTSNVIMRSDNVLDATGVSYTVINTSNAGFPKDLGVVTPINRLAVNPANSNYVWFCAGGYNDTLKVYRSDNAGASWRNFSAGLPNVPVLSIVAEESTTRPNAVYIGTDIGVFYRDDNLNAWVAFRNGLPVSPVTDLRINPGAGKIRAGTYGRGIWESPLYSSCSSSFTVSGIQGGYQFHQSSGTILFTAEVGQGLGSEMHLKSGNSITFQTGTHILNGSQLKAQIGPCGSGIPEMGAQPTGQQVPLRMAPPVPREN